MSESAPGTASAAHPSLRIIAGHPTPEELAAVTVLLSVVGSSDTSAQPAVRQIGSWADPAHALRAELRPGPGAWRAGLR